MGIFDYFRPVSTWPPEKVRKFLLEHKGQEYQLLDVRQPKEYLRGHLPGALLVPLDRLREEMEKLDPAKPTITYCGIGVRSRAAAATLKNAGFTNVHSMAGGINAWEGHSAEGEPDLGAAYFSPGHTLGEFIGLAWLIEKGTRSFYLAMANRFRGTEEESFFRQMAGVEERHQAFLESLFEKMSGQSIAGHFPQSLLPSLPEEPVLEGGIRLAEALQWAGNRELKDIVQLAIGFETNACDRYLLMAKEQKNPDVRELFQALAEEEKAHLIHLTGYLNRLENRA
ncbi:MAG: hypothetical protein JXB25_11520 [Deltaproteobacteria bacterium]|nr:hypothetical protein [Deltaproteobacteria bacterium]